VLVGYSQLLVFVHLAEIDACFGRYASAFAPPSLDYYHKLTDEQSSVCSITNKYSLQRVTVCCKNRLIQVPVAKNG
jgi:hypothetical protein